MRRSRKPFRAPSVRRGFESLPLRYRSPFQAVLQRMSRQDDLGRALEFVPLDIARSQTGARWHGEIAPPARRGWEGRRGAREEPHGAGGPSGAGEEPLGASCRRSVRSALADCLGAYAAPFTALRIARGEHELLAGELDARGIPTRMAA